MKACLVKRVACKNGTLVTLRSATVEDSHGLAQLTNLVLADGEGQVRLLEESLPDKLGDKRDWIRKHEEHADWLLLVAKIDGVIVGCLDFSTGTIARLAHRGVFGMSVAPDWRNLGIGSMMLTKLIEWGSENPRIEKISLAVLATNTQAISLYKKMGFREEGRRLREVKISNDDYVDDILMYRFLTR